MAAVFTRFNIYHRTRGGTLLAWELNSQFPSTTPITFQILATRPGVDDFHVVGTAVDQYVFEDSQQWIYGKAPRLHYMVQFEYDGEVYQSEIKQILGNFSTRDKALAKEIIRKETLRLQKFAGECGYLYKRKRWGTRCTECLDYDTGQVKNAHC